MPETDAKLYNVLDQRAVIAADIAVHGDNVMVMLSEAVTFSLQRTKEGTVFCFATPTRGPSRRGRVYQTGISDLSASSRTAACSPRLKPACDGVRMTRDINSAPDT